MDRKNDAGRALPGSMVHCRRNAPKLFSHRENNRADSIRPYERLEISAQLIQWHRLRRGGYQPPANVANF